jgi:large subunit ribosomal protein L6
LPVGVDATVDPKQTKIALTGIDRQQVGQVAAEMRSLRPPDPYKNKGVRYAGESVEEEGR